MNHKFESFSGSQTSLLIRTFVFFGFVLMRTIALMCLLSNASVNAAEHYYLRTNYLHELRSARLSYTNSEYSNAVSHYQAAIQIAPQSFEARFGCLLSFLGLERFPEAEWLATRIISEYPANYYANLRMAYALRMQKKYGQAEAVLNHALSLYPTDVSLLLELAQVKLARRQNATAQYLFLDILTLSPDNPVALQQLAAPQLLNNPQDEPIPQPWIPPNLRQPKAPRELLTESSLYFGYLDYHGTVNKDHAHAVGLYASAGYGPEHFLEVEGDFLRKYYRGFPALRQWDATLAYANYSIPHVKLRAGGHYVVSEDSFTDQGWVAFGGASCYGDRWIAGVDVHYSKHPNLLNPLDVVQLTPHLGATLWRGENLTWYNDLRAHWINLNRNTFNRRNTLSIEDRLTLNWRRWTFSAFGWAGEQLYAVRNEGFALYNLGEIHKAGYGLEVRCDLSSHLALTLRVNREEFKDTATTPHAASDMYLAMLSWKF